MGYRNTTTDRTRRQQQSVYFIQQGESGPIKIGIAFRPRTRLAELQTSSPYPLRLLGVVAGGRETEKRLHAQFEHCRLQGEWFEPRAELLGEIDALFKRERALGRDPSLPAAADAAPLLAAKFDDAKLLDYISQQGEVSEYTVSILREVIKRVGRGSAREWELAVYCFVGARVFPDCIERFPEFEPAAAAVLKGWDPPAHEVATRLNVAVSTVFAQARRFLQFAANYLTQAVESDRARTAGEERKGLFRDRWN